MGKPFPFMRIFRDILCYLKTYTKVTEGSGPVCSYLTGHSFEYCGVHAPRIPMLNLITHCSTQVSSFALSHELFS